MSVFDNIRPGNGEIKFQNYKDVYRKSNELVEASKLLREYGGRFLILAESSKKSVSRPDLKRDDTALIEEKHASSLEALDKRLRVGIRQLIYKNNHIPKITKRVIVVNATEKLLKSDWEEIFETVIHRIFLARNTTITGVIVRKAGQSRIVVDFG